MQSRITTTPAILRVFRPCFAVRPGLLLNDAALVIDATIAVAHQPAPPAVTGRCRAARAEQRQRSQRKARLRFLQRSEKGQ